ncbi:MAG: hypothetical protein IJL83_07740 [Clostridia bacterium]|nr:hypothetical protein [Clostridia bacterium]
MKFTAFLLAILMVAAIFTGMFPLTAAAEGSLIGDIDKDGELTVSDSLLTLRAMNGLYDYDEGDLPVFDVWNDGAIGVDDALGIMRSSMGMIGSFGKTGATLSFTPNAAATAATVTQAMLDRAIVSTDGSSRIAKVMQKAARGEKISVVTLGGSITHGSGASTENKRYANIVANWWRSAFPGTTVNFHNSGIGATGSMLGVHRLDRDVFAHDPDVLVVEFAVNDTNSGTQESYENLIRRVVTQSPDTAIIMLFMTTEWFDDKQAEEVPIGRAYGIPMISYRDAIKPECESGRYTFKNQLSDDGTHPNDFGYAIVGNLITSYLDGVKAVYADYNTIIPEIPAQPMTSEKYMNAKMYWCNEGLEATSLGSWVKDTYAFYDFRGSWSVTKGKQPLVFDVDAQNVKILYEKSISTSKSGVIQMRVDSTLVGTVDSYFANGWGDYQTIADVYDGTEVKHHKLRFTLMTGTFRIAAILLS